MSSEDEIKEYDIAWCDSYPYKAYRCIRDLKKSIANLEKQLAEAVQQERERIWKIVGPGLLLDCSPQDWNPYDRMKQSEIGVWMGRYGRDE